MSLRSRVCGLALALATSAFGWPALAQQATTCPASINHPADGPFGGLARGLVQTPCADPSLPPATLAPLTAAPAASAPEETPVADLHVASTALGFDAGIAPAPGRAVGYRGRQYLVVDVAAVGNGPTFSGGSRFVITTKGGELEVGLKAIDSRERQMAAASSR